jgi:signal transduction histidine kinase/DNA-binding response OmpR family regulator
MPDSDKVNILVVDDLPEKLLVYQSILEELQQNVVMAASGAEALKLLLQHSFAVILLDVNMPIMDGFETAALIRTHRRSQHTPIIFITSFFDDVRPLQGYAHGAVDYILAPVAPAVLRAKVKVFVELFRMNQQVKRQAEERIILAEERAKRAAAEEANRNSAFLAEASAVLAKSLDLEANLRSLTRLVVPYLADLSVVWLMDETARLRQSAWAWIDPEQEVVVQPLAQVPPLPGLVAHAVERVLASGGPEAPASFDPPLELPEVEPESHDNGRQPPRPPFALRQVLVFPLSARSRTVGALMLALSSAGRTFRPGDFALAEDLATRAGIAVDNALLVRNIQETDRRKDEFLAMLAHELRNPLAPIRNAVQVMRVLSSDDDRLRNARDLIERQVRHMTRLVDDLLDVSRITRGKIQLRPERLDAAVAVANAVETSRPLIESRRHELSLQLPSEPLQIKADPARLAQVLSNLLNNAAKYTPEGGRIWLAVEREGGYAVFRVRDNGTGIPPQILPHIFDLFTQADQSLDRAHGGLGIGLTLVRRLIEMQHGTVTAFSAGPGQGSEFVVRLPALPTEQPPAPADNGATVPHASAKGCRVLVVDDHVDAAASLAMLLRLYGHEVRTASDGPSALEEARSFRPEVVLLDIGLPGMDGYEVARRLRKEIPDDHITLAALTGYGQDRDRSRSQEAGFDHHLVKPVDPEALQRLLTSCLANRAGAS